LVHNAKCKQGQGKKSKRNPNVVVIGRIMETRVKPYAMFFGFSWYAPVPPVDPNDPKPKLPTVKQNRRWIRKQMNKQRTIYDIGAGPARRYSAHYKMEKWEVRHFRHIRKKIGRRKVLISPGYVYPGYRFVPFKGLFCKKTRKRQTRSGTYDSSYLCN